MKLIIVVIIVIMFLKKSKINVVESDDEVTFNNDLSGFKVCYFKPRQTKLRAAKNSTNIYNPSKTVQHINDISKNDIFAQRFYLYQGNGDYIDYQYYHGNMVYLELEQQYQAILLNMG